ncbi:MAG TPA: hypothetical protein VFX57_01315 [Sulfuricurvum sp.]|nr:hypothetical protein [Sulfuricurvum sp.]
MAKGSIIALMGIVWMLGLGGCGYKAPPYYEAKPVPQEKSVAL